MKPEVFLLARRVMLAEAEALSQKVASNNPPPPPPAPKPNIPTVRIGDRSAGNQVIASVPTPSGGYPMGTFPLTAGKNRVRLKIIGKALESTGYLVGVDKLVLTRVG
jgi:hypothetical protein